LRQAEAFNHFDAAHLARFSQYHRGRQGVAVLGFAVSAGGVDAIRAKYAELHPKLLLPDTPTTYPGAKVLEVFAYYTGEKLTTDADPGTMIRFVELCEDAGSDAEKKTPTEIEATEDRGMTLRQLRGIKRFLEDSQADGSEGTPERFGRGLRRVEREESVRSSCGSEV